MAPRDDDEATEQFDAETLRQKAQRARVQAPPPPTTPSEGIAWVPPPASSGIVSSDVPTASDPFSRLEALRGRDVPFVPLEPQPFFVLQDGGYGQPAFSSRGDESGRPSSKESAPDEEAESVTVFPSPSGGGTPSLATAGAEPEGSHLPRSGEIDFLSGEHLVEEDEPEDLVLETGDFESYSAQDLAIHSLVEKGAQEILVDSYAPQPSEPTIRHEADRDEVPSIWPADPEPVELEPPRESADSERPPPSEPTRERGRAPAQRGGRPERTALLGSSGYVPKIAKPPTPAWIAEADSEELELHRREAWRELHELLLARLGRAQGAVPRARLLVRLAGVLEERLDDQAKALDALLEAFVLTPDDPPLVESVERLANRLDRWPSLVERAMERLGTAKPGDKAALLEHLTHWYGTELRQPDSAAHYAAELERLDPSRPVLLKRRAQAERARGDIRAYTELLQRSLERTRRPDERVALHMALGRAQRAQTEAFRHFESALSLAPENAEVLEAFEQAAAQLDRHEEVQWALRQLLVHATNDAQRVAAHLRLAELLEKRFLKRDEAADVLVALLTLKPDQSVARLALERCYQTMRRWPELIEIMCDRAALASPEESVGIYAAAAEMAEDKLGDLELAAATLRKAVLAVDADAELLGRAAELAERMQDTAAVAEWRGRLAELATDPREKARQYVAIAGMVESDPLAARGYYERAVKADPASLQAWEALERVAREMGDERAVIAALERRIEATESQRLKGQLLEELATRKSILGDAEGAAAAYAAALRADPSNETAAVAVIDRLVSEERWAEAAPICELLVTAASRDRDPELLYGRLRTAARIAVHLDDMPRALGACLAASDALPHERQPLVDMVEIFSRSDLGDLGPRGAVALSRVLAASSQLEPESLAKLGRLLAEQGEHSRAVEILTSVLEGTTSEEDETGAHPLAESGAELYAILADALFATGEVSRAATLKLRLARAEPDPEARFAGYVTVIELFAHKLADLDATRSVVDEALVLRPDDEWLLHTATWLYDELGDYEALERTYRARIGQAKEDGDMDRVFSLYTELARVYRDKLDDPDRARKALEGAKKARPDDPEVKKAMLDLHLVHAEPDKALLLVREDLRRNPHDIASYELLYRLCLEMRAFDKAHCTAQVLAELRPPSPEEARFLGDFPPIALGQIPGSLVEEAWASHVFHGDLDPTLTSIFAWMTPPLARMRQAGLNPQERIAAMGRPFTRTHSRLADKVKELFHDAGEIFGFGAPPILVGKTPPGSLFAPALSPYGALYVDPEALASSEDQLTYLVGKRLAEQRPELAARAFFPTPPELNTILATAVRIGFGEGGTAKKQDQGLLSVMSEEELEAITQSVQLATEDGRKLDVERWTQAADLSSTRLALLLCQDVGVATRAISSEPESPSELGVHEKLGELFLFATSDLYADLRQAIGVNAADEAEQDGG